MAERMTPWPPKPAIRISGGSMQLTEILPGRRSLRYEFRLAAYCLRLFYVFVAQRFGVLCPHHGSVVGAVTVYKFADDDFPGHGEADLAGRCAVADFALLFVVLHGIE